MTIQDFSKRTGIPKSTLRYYEAEKLLCSVDRNGSGYRIYREDQVSVVNLISSLRLADIPMKEIKLYLNEENNTNRQGMKKHWIENIRMKQEILHIGLQYLESDSLLNEIYLIDKKRETIIWFSVQSEKGGFKNHFLKRAQELKVNKILVDSWYLKYVSGDEYVKAHIGFGISCATDTDRLTEIESVERMGEGIYITMPFHDPIEQIHEGYYKLMDYAIQHEWIATGPIVEWYRGPHFTELDLIMPVTQMTRKEEK